ncbi:asparaginase [Flagellimonas allohymeniacidonis]|uniref:asparaginase n=1 Tax=Flagellimonas allohymeniacidonis TaxID=2517819 RepID=A0A4Q8QEZ9_9FLAO|nr:asparaginase [Allomuricauda hymeniacidonis]TAI47093.1 asparaginase [Allomuricauda hymeniacidonis]
MAKKSNILLIYTGGTIGMVKDYKTGALRAFNFNELINNLPELNQLECEIRGVSFKKPIDSSSMNPKHWATIATIVENNYADFDGFVVLHGSDTMSYSASALSFMLENLDKPVIFTGSQLPIGDLRTDAKENLITSIQIAALTENGIPIIREVGLYFEYKLYRANRTTKINAEHFEAFTSLNYPPLIESGVHLNVFYPNLYTGTDSKTPLMANKKMDTNVAILKLFPGLCRNVLESVLKISGLKALVLETYGAGNAPTEDWFLTALENALANGLHIINVTQCSGGSVAMGQYESSRRLKAMSMINGKDITTEAAITKAMYLLGNRVPSKDFKRLFETSLRGEMRQN